jgi:hypothetical protein
MPQQGMTLIFVFVGIIRTAVALMGYVFSDIRDVEKTVSDYDAVKWVEEAPSGTGSSPALP